METGITLQNKLQKLQNRAARVLTFSNYDADAGYLFELLKAGSHMIADLIMICDPRSYGNQPLDRTWFYLLRSSAMIADLIAICDLRSAIIWKPAFRWKKRSSPAENQRATMIYRSLHGLALAYLIICSRFDKRENAYYLRDSGNKLNVP